MKKRFWILSIVFMGLVSLSLLGFSPPRSERYKQWGWVTAMGAAVLRSENYILQHIVGDRFIGIVVEGTKKIFSGFLSIMQILNEFPEEAGNYDIAWIHCYTHRGGLIISESVWQRDNSPYFVWEIKNPEMVPVGYSYSLDSEPDDTIDTKEKFADYSSSAISDGKHIFYVKAQNSAGVWGQQGQFSIWIDTKAPSVERVSPESGSLLNKRDEPIRIWFSDNLSGLNPQTVSCRVNGARVYLRYDKSCSCFVSYGILPEGKVVVSLEAKDLAGNKMQDYLWGFSVDTIAPIGSVTINYGAYMTNSVAVVVSLDAKDNFSGVSKFRIGNSRSECETGNWKDFVPELDWRLNPYSGTQSVYVQFMDKAGNISRVYSDSIVLQLIAPDTMIISGPTGVVKQHDAFFKYQGTVSGCYFSYKLDNGKWSKWSPENSVMLVNLSDGRHIFSVRAAKDINNNHVIDEEEIDPTPAQRVWFIGELNRWEPEIKIKFWRMQ